MISYDKVKVAEMIYNNISPDGAYIVKVIEGFFIANDTCSIYFYFFLIFLKVKANLALLANFVFLLLAAFLNLLTEILCPFFALRDLRNAPGFLATAF
jgi:hypothetical protein